jgi:hypothetical protein
VFVASGEFREACSCAPGYFFPIGFRPERMKVV